MRDMLLIGLDLMRKGETAVSTSYKVPKDFRVGAGFWGAGRGYLTHHAVMDGGVRGSNWSRRCSERTMTTIRRNGGS